MKLILKCMVLAFCVAFLDGVKFRCDYTYTHFGWFKYHEIPATWYDARLQCHLEGSTLASPTTDELKSLMLASFCKPEIFTGIHATFSGLYHTIEGIPLAKIPHIWAPYEPDNKNNAESCLTLNSDGQLADVRCDQPRPYICLKEHAHVDPDFVFNVCGTSDSEYHFHTETNKCYKFHTIPRTFERANFACSAEGGHLAIINSDAEAKVITAVYAQYPSAKMIGNFYKELAFIGFSDWGESGDWITVHGQSIQEAGYAKFAAGQPDNATAGEFCGSVNRNGLLYDSWCLRPMPFICEKGHDYPAVCDTVDSPLVSNFTRVCDNDVHNRDNQTDETGTIDIRFSQPVKKFG